MKILCKHAALDYRGVIYPQQQSLNVQLKRSDPLLPFKHPHVCWGYQNQADLEAYFQEVAQVDPVVVAGDDVGVACGVGQAVDHPCEDDDQEVDASEEGHEDCVPVVEHGAVAAVVVAAIAVIGTVATAIAAAAG